MPDFWHPFLLDEVLIKTLIACLLCGLIGLEREYRQKTAGFRTHMLVGLGSTMFTLLSLHGFGASDPSRIAAQIVSGIGFIGAGAILRQGLSVRGLTTASTLWLVASIGMAVGVGWYTPALVVTSAALLALIALPYLEAALPSWPTALVAQVRLAVTPGLHVAVREFVLEHGWTIRRGHMERSADRTRLNFTLWRQSGTHDDLQALIVALEAYEGVLELGWEMMEGPS
ncbi:MAG: MgtC/SapB family protein [Candidatus Sericytochromatia bacterium]